MLKNHYISKQSKSVCAHIFNV